MDIRVLGPLTVEDDGERLALRPRCRALLAILVSRYPTGITRDGLADALWPDADADRAANSVRVHLTHLRASLRAAGDLIPRGDARYELRVERAALDACRFEDAVARARSLAGAGSPATAAAEYSTALAEWRGAAYEDFSGVEALRSETTRLEELRLEAVGECASAMVDDERPEEATGLLAPVVAAYPTRESLARLLMLGYARTGRQSDALAVFGQVKRALREDLGLVPGRALSSLADRIIVAPETLDRRGMTRQPRRARVPDALIGRTLELDRLRSTWAQTLDGTPTFVVIEGEAGIGKTALTRVFAKELTAAGITSIIGVCDPAPSESFHPFPDLSRGVLELDPPTVSAPETLAQIARLAPDLEPLLPTTTTLVEPAAGRLQLFDAVSSLIGRPDTPRLVVIDDLHWATADAIALLRHVLRGAAGSVMIIGTVRSGEQRDSPFEQARTGGRFSRPDLHLELAGLDQHGVAAMVDNIAPPEVRNSLALEEAALTDVSAGHPLRLREIVAHYALDPEARIEEIAPDDTRALVARRFRTLDTTTQKLLRAAAVFGQAFSVRAVGAVAAIDEESALDAIDQAIDAGLIAEADQADEFTFSHPWVRNAIYYSMTAARRTRLHLACADEMERETDGDSSAAELARHLVAADSRAPAARRFEACRCAAVLAAGRFAHTDAADWFEYALASAGADVRIDPIQLAQTRLGLGTALEASGRLEAARAQYLAAVEAARDLDDPDLLAEAVASLCPRVTLIDPAFARQLRRVLEATLDRFPVDDPRRIEVLRGVQSARFYFDAEGLELITAEAERLLGFTTDPALEHTAMGMRYQLREGDPGPTQLDAARELQAHAARHGLDSFLGFDERRLLNELVRAGLHDEFENRLAAFERSAWTTRTPLHMFWAASVATSRRLLIAADDQTEESIEATAVLGRQLEIPDAPGAHLLQTFTLRYQQGRTRELANQLGAPASDAPEILAGTALSAVTYAEAGDTDAARHLLNRVADPKAVDIRLPHNNFRPGALALFGGTAALCGTPEQRRVLREALYPFASEFCAFGTGTAFFGTGHHWLGRLAIADGDLDAAVEHLEHAARICQTVGATYWAERARQELAAFDITPPEQ